MSERQTINTNIRLNLGRADDRRAWAYLQSMDRTKYKSYSRAVVAALNDFFSRQERLADDPYLETREKEDAFLLRVQEAIERGLQNANHVSAFPPTQSNASAQPLVRENAYNADEDLDTAMDFINGL